MTDKSRACGATPREQYEPPQAIRLSDSATGVGGCNGGSAVVVCEAGNGGHKVGYRERGFTGICVTGKAATYGCHAGAGVV